MVSVPEIQHQICRIINDIGGRIKFTKEHNFLAQVYYILSNREPAINIEALLLGERFGVIIGTPPAYRYIMRKSPYRIFHCTDVDSFRQQFNDFKNEKLS